LSVCLLSLLPLPISGPFICSTFFPGQHISKSIWPLFKNLFIYFIIHLFTCAYIVWVISPPLPFPLQFQAGPVLPLSLILLKKRDKHKKEHKMFFLVKDSYSEIFLALLLCTSVMTHVDSSLTDLYTGTDSLLMITSVALRFLY
jgi:hypothetical protein